MTQRFQRIHPCLWFDRQAEDAVNFYTSIFPNSKVGAITRYGEAGPGPAGSVLTISFELDGQPLTALNGGPYFKFTEAISLVVNRDTQEEVDYYWEKLSDGGQEVQCGWVKDKFGLSWQIVPVVLFEMLQGQGRRKIAARHEGDAENEKTRRRRIATGLSAELGR